MHPLFCAPRTIEAIFSHFHTPKPRVLTFFSPANMIKSGRIRAAIVRYAQWIKRKFNRSSILFSPLPPLDPTESIYCCRLHFWHPPKHHFAPILYILPRHRQISCSFRKTAAISFSSAASMKAVLTSLPYPPKESLPCFWVLVPPPPKHGRF